VVIRNLIKCHKADVVAIACIFRARVPEPYKEFHGLALSCI
jgi:hypothetical protein